jgi:hypothetical protein
MLAAAVMPPRWRRLTNAYGRDQIMRRRQNVLPGFEEQ